MNDRYKITISNKNIYKEIELSSSINQLKIGTNSNCDVRLRKDMFFEEIELIFQKNEDKWSVFCSDNIYLNLGDARKLITKVLEHGDELFIKYQNSDYDVFSMSFMLDFDYKTKNYERVIDLGNNSSLSIGATPDSNIIINSQFLNNDKIVLNLDTNQLKVLSTQYGVYLNGKKIDKECAINNCDFISIADFSFYYKDKKLWTEIDDHIKCVGLEYQDKEKKNDYPKFNRNTRIKHVLSEEQIEVLDPPAIPTEPKINWFTRLLPSIVMVCTSIAMGLMSGGMMIIFSVVSGVMGVVTGIISIVEAKSDFKKNSQERIEKYNNYVSKKRNEIEQKRNEEKECLEKIYMSLDDELNNYSSFSANLFDRIKEDDDFLDVLLGKGDIVAKQEITYKKQEKLEVEDNLQAIPEEICKEYEYVHDAPVICKLKDINALGIIGKEEYRFEIMKNMIVDLCSRQYYTDLKLFFVAEECNKDKVNWLRFLPFVYNDVLGIRNIVDNDDSKNIIFEYLYKELTFREQNKGEYTHFVVFLYDEYGFKTHPISKFVEKAKDLSVTFIFMGAERANIYLGCNYIVNILSNQKAELINSKNRSETIEFIYPHISDEQAQAVVNVLAPVYSDEISLEGTLTKNITLFELLNIIAVDDIDLSAKWATSKVYESMEAPIGVTKNDIVTLNLHDKGDGPHGLVAGTTGSGKSEILQTYILSMATLFHPYEISFLIIDFKGGGMVNQFKDLPHLLGAITNIDGKEINRSLKSIKAELQKRQRLFSDVNVNHIDKYIKKYKAGEAEEALPHLIIIVDEFAELKAEQPEFMKELISAARIGRSLGVHLILATQKPSGQVNEQIWSNSRFKLCLKVQTQEDSNEVLKSPLAAEIKEPGRAYLQVGNNEKFELFQSAYSGASEKVTENAVKEYSIYELKDNGRKVPVYERKKKKSGEKTYSQLEAIVKYVNNYCKQIGLKPLPDICLPSLKDKILLPDYGNESDNSIIANIGMYDDPDNQYQGNYSINLTNDNLMVIGSSLSGKTNLLQTIIKDLSTRYTPNDVNIYIIDFASMILKNFENLNHVGGVVTSSEDEKLKNLIKLLYSEIEERKEKMLSIGVSSFSAYKEAGNTDLPQIVLIVDNLTALKELYFQDDDELLNICREGLAVGISVVIANLQTTGIGYRYLSNFSERIALFCNDSGEYSSLFDHCSEKVENIRGRCLVEIDRTHLDCQCYLAFEGEKEIDRVNATKEYIKSINMKNKGLFAKKIPIIPENLSSIFIEEEFGNYMQEKYEIVTGLDYGTVEPNIMQFNSLGLLAISGREKNGRHNFIKYISNMMNKMYPDDSKYYVVDSINKKLESLKNNSNTVNYSTISENAVIYIKEIESQLKERYDALLLSDESVLENSQLLVLVIDNADAISAISNDMNALDAYKNIVGRYKDMKVCIITYIENKNITYNDPEILKNIRDNRNILFFDDVANMKLFDVPLAMMRKYKKPIEVGDAYYIKDNDVIKLKTPISVKK